jgi:high affinity Mn2+ porin
MVDEGPNELGSIKPVNYIRLLAGKLCLADIFDINAYANSPRTQFLNWCLMNNGAWDYAANTRGYTYAIAAIAQYKSWTYTAALGTLPKVANGPDLNTDLSEAYSLNAEVHKAYKLKGRSGNARLLVFHNNCNMGNYDQATHDITRDIVANRRFGRTKTGLGFNADQELSKTAGVFLRTGWNDGINETWAYTEVDRTLTAGLSLNGASWKRANDNLSVALLANGLSPDHRAYLKAGGKGFELGDGNLNYANEAGAEIFYSCKPVAKLDIWLSADYQFIVNPGYNRDRGPVNVFSFRLHAEL